MPTKITFQNHLLVSAVTRASRVAPSKGNAFDKAAGIVISAFPSQRLAIIRATDLDTSFRQEIVAVDAEGDDAVWRIPSAILSDFCNTLLLGEECYTTFIDRGDDRIRIAADKAVSAFTMLDRDSFPVELPIPDFEMIEANAMSTAVEQVSWACEKKSTILGGVHIDGEHVIGVNQYSLALTPCRVGITKPLTAPLDILKGILKSASDVRLASDSQKLYIAIDDDSIATTNLQEGTFPNLKPLRRENFRGTVEVHKTPLIEAFSRISVLAKMERVPSLTVTIDTSGMIKMLVLDVNVAQHGRIQDKIDVTTDFEENFEIRFIPTMLQQAIEHCRGEVIYFDFGFADDPSKDSERSVRIRDKSGYQCYVMPKVA